MNSVGEVIEVRGTRIVIRVFEDSNKETLFFKGKKYKGISIREHLIIKRGFREIVAIVEGEYLDERKMDEDGDDYIRKVELKPIGYFYDEAFFEGIKYLPMIKDEVYLVSEEDISKIYGRNCDGLPVGELLKEGVPISLPWSKLFNTHIGIFGNTGSGKSNTLANLYTRLFEEKLDKLIGKSKFIILDFNGEYTKDQLVSSAQKKVYELNTRVEDGDRFPLTEEEFWDSEVFGILFKATENTQKPFLSRVVRGRNRFADSPESLEFYTKNTFIKALTSTSPKKELSEMLKTVARVMRSEELEEKLTRLAWHGRNENYYFPPARHMNGGEDDPVYQAEFSGLINDIEISDDINPFDELIIRINLQLLNDLINGYVQFEHIQPLLKRIEASITLLRRVLVVGDDDNEKLLTVVSLRKAKQEVKKVIPLLLAKYYYEKHKELVVSESPPQHTMHLIVDEAHNVLSMQSAREHESWKDYRLELFEEIIKEGRKFGMFLTLSSQRPADISPTIMSQIHNFFIHRLVNERDIFLLENTITTLDSLSKGLIPNLAKGCCIVTGTSFDLPMIIQFDRLKTEYQPDSDDVDLVKLWE